MRKKLIFLLAMASTVSTALAVNANSTYSPGDYSETVILKVDIDAAGNTGPNETQPGWESWEMPNNGPFGPVTKNFGSTTCQLDGVTATGGSGNLYANDFIDDDIDVDFAMMLSDAAFVYNTAGGQGMDYIDLTIRLGADYANHNVDVTLWSWSPVPLGSGLEGFVGAGEPEASKWAVWGTINPSVWLDDNGYSPNGYGYSIPPGESNMPAGLEALVGDMAIEHGTAPWLSELDGSTGTTFASTVNVTLDENGQTKVYGWADMTDATGSKIIVLNGFAISNPEPATIALLGFGGLTLLRKRKK